MRFNPPPNWPRFPNGWTPPDGWQPDPLWPQPPFGWPLWVEEEETFVISAPPPIRPGTPYTPYPNAYTPYASMSPTREPWHKRTLTIVLFLVFFFPVGLVLVWQRQDWSARRRWVVTGVTAIVVLIALVSPNPQTQTTVQVTPVAGSGTTAPASSAAAGSPSIPATAQPSASQSAAVVGQPVRSASATDTPSQSASTVAAAVVSAPRTTAAPTTHSAKPSPAPTTHSASHTPSTCGAPSNPFGYNFCGNGAHVTSPPLNVCDYFNCINSFWNGNGYMVECNDGMYSMSGGLRGACSYHDGEERAVYSG
jgi:hypothetical protein